MNPSRGIKINVIFGIAIPILTSERSMGQIRLPSRITIIIGNRFSAGLSYMQEKKSALVSALHSRIEKGVRIHVYMNVNSILCGSQPTYRRIPNHDVVICVCDTEKIG